MPSAAKERRCIICGETKESCFYDIDKSYCKEHRNKREVGRALKQHECRYCGEKNKENFNGASKSVCRLCYNAKARGEKLKLKKKKIIVIKRELTDKEIMEQKLQDLEQKLQKLEQKLK